MKFNPSKLMRAKIKDWCYVYNFKTEDVQLHIDFPAGKGMEFKEYMEDLIESLTEEINEAFENESMNLQKINYYRRMSLKKKNY